mmetsp:Transcript_10809/g.20991  ORF Transcript_10809/g.20991 Transcript_10809/m.20991 type:complete len:375 (-) Transcript_10809:289-1413(-)
MSCPELVLADVSPSQQVTPWQSMELPANPEEVYLEQSKSQLLNLFPKQQQALHTDLFLFNSAEIEFARCQNSAREDIASQVCHFRDDVIDVGNLIVETIQFRLQDDGERWCLQERACFEELKKCAGETKRKFQDIKSFFETSFQEQRQHMATFVASAENTNHTKWNYGLLSIGMGGLCLVAGKWLWLDGRKIDYTSKNKMIPNAILNVVAWALRDGLGWKQADEDVQLYRAHMLCIAVPLFTWPMSIFMGRDALRAWRNEQNYQSLKDQANRDMKFLQENRGMWAGMECLIDFLLRKADYLLNFHDPARRDRVTLTLQELGEKRFQLSMSIDIYTVWLSKHGIFPSNISVPAMIGGDRFNRIMNVCSPKRRWFC